MPLRRFFFLISLAFAVIGPGWVYAPVWAAAERVIPQELFLLTERGYDLLAQQQYGLALEAFQGAAAHGYPRAFQGLVQMYRAGLGVAADSKKANELERQGFEACRQAALAGDPVAQVILADFLSVGQGGIPKDEKEAAGWYQQGVVNLQKAVESGDTYAMVRLAYMYYSGIGVNLDTQKALALYNQAAELGSTRAQYSLGIHYLNHHDDTVDENEPISWLLKAAQAMNRFGLMARKLLDDGEFWNDLVENRIRWAQLSGDHEKAVKRAELALNIARIVYGDAHVNTLKSRGILAEIQAAR